MLLLVLVEDEIPVVCEEVDDGHEAVGRCPHHSCSVCSLEVGLDDFVILAVPVGVVV